MQLLSYKIFRIIPKYSSLCQYLIIIIELVDPVSGKNQFQYCEFD